MKYCILDENIDIPDELLQEFEETTGRPISEAKLKHMISCEKRSNSDNIQNGVIESIKDYIEMTKQMPDITKKLCKGYNNFKNKQY